MIFISSIDEDLPRNSCSEPLILLVLLLPLVRDGHISYLALLALTLMLELLIVLLKVMDTLKGAHMLFFFLNSLALELAGTHA